MRLRVGNHPGGQWGTGYKEILNTDIEANAYFVGIALDDYSALFAAAPDLLEAAKTALDNLTPKYSGDHIVIKQLSAAIGKATGQNP